MALLISLIQKTVRTQIKRIFFFFGSCFFKNKTLIGFLSLWLQHFEPKSLKQFSNLESLRWLGFLLAQKDRSYSQLAQDVWVLFRTNTKQNGFFVEVGACDPIYLSNSALLEKDYFWNGILIEPNPKMAEKLRLERSSKVAEVAIAPGEEVTLNLASEPEFSVVGDSKVIKNHSFFKSTGTEISVKASTLTDVLQRFDAPKHFDFLSIDIEGGELFALDSLDFAKFRPRLISIEHNHTSNRNLIKAFLESKGYERDPLGSSTSWDDWYIDKNPNA